MIATVLGLLGPAVEAGIKMPEGDPEVYDRADYPHWHVYSVCQLGCPMPSPTSHWDNAKRIAAIPDEKIRSVTPADLLALGWEG